MKKPILYLWAILLSMALLCVQGVNFHVHSIDHDQQHDHIPAEGAIEHSHLSVAHLSIDNSHADHHDEVVSEIDGSPDGLLNKVSSNAPTLALLTAVFAILLLGQYQTTYYRRRANDVITPWRYHLFPPLRAPPL